MAGRSVRFFDAAMHGCDWIFDISYMFTGSIWNENSMRVIDVPPAEEGK